MDTGFVRSLEDPEWQSSQIDLLLTRKDFGHPLAVFPETKIYPIEAVIGFVEVTKRIDKRKLLEDFGKVKDLKQKTKRTYVLPYSFARAAGMPGTDSPPDSSDMLKKVYATISDLEPRFFYFAFESDWTEPASLCRVFQAAGEELGVHCHGLFVPQFGFFMHKAVQTPPSRHVVEYMTAMPDAFIAFLSQVLGALQSFTVVPSNAGIPLSTDIFRTTISTTIVAMFDHGCTTKALANREYGRLVWGFALHRRCDGGIAPQNCEIGCMRRQRSWFEE